MDLWLYEGFSAAKVCFCAWLDSGGVFFLWGGNLLDERSQKSVDLVDLFDLLGPLLFYVVGHTLHARPYFCLPGAPLLLPA